ncbi:hypothetical protein Bp8pS_105 [Bacillus phage vB_BpuM-BpSp]|nr:hypothetical protein Bp8pS_105 [Bacillus phage vB_BpuM-BpSp]
MAIIKRDYNEVLVDNMTQYYGEVVKFRAIFNVLDSLKPIHRRILLVMNNHKFINSKPHVKSAKVTGLVVGN